MDNSMDIDNLEIIKSLLKFESKDDFYFLQILQRKKENQLITSNSRVIKNYYIKNIEYLDMRYKEIKQLCIQFNARAMIRLNKRSFEKVAFKTMENIAHTMMSRDYDFINKAYDRACGQSHNETNKKWILDIDNDIVASPLMLAYINYNCEPICESIEDSKIYEIIPSKNGFHVITKPFNVKTFREKYPNIEIHKDNPTNLFISNT